MQSTCSHPFTNLGSKKKSKWVSKVRYNARHLSSLQMYYLFIDYNNSNDYKITTTMFADILINLSKIEGNKKDDFLDVVF